MIKINIILRRFFVVFLLIACNVHASSMNEIRIAGGNMTGIYYPVALQICSIITKYSPITRCEVLATSGSINNLSLLLADKVDFAFVQSDVARDATMARGVFSGQKPYSSLRSVGTLFPEVFSMLVRDELGIINFSDLSGRKIGVNLKGAGAKNGLMNLFRYFSFDKTPQIIHMVDSQMPQALCNGEVDAIVLFTGHPSGSVSQVTSTCDVEFVSIDPLKLDRLIVENIVYERATLPAKSYKTIARNAHSFATKAILVTNDSSDADKVRLLTKMLKRYFDEFKASYPVLNDLDKKDVFSAGLIEPYQE